MKELKSLFGIYVIGFYPAAWVNIDIYQKSAHSCSGNSSPAKHDEFTSVGKSSIFNVILFSTNSTNFTKAGISSQEKSSGQYSKWTLHIFYTQSLSIATNLASMFVHNISNTAQHSNKSFNAFKLVSGSMVRDSKEHNVYLLQNSPCTSFTFGNIQTCKGERLKAVRQASSIIPVSSARSYLLQFSFNTHILHKYIKTTQHYCSSPSNYNLRALKLLHVIKIQESRTKYEAPTMHTRQLLPFDIFQQYDITNGTSLSYSTQSSNFLLMTVSRPSLLNVSL